MIRETYHVYNRHDEYDEVAHSDDHEYDLHGQVIGFTHRNLRGSLYTILYTSRQCNTLPILGRIQSIQTTKKCVPSVV